MKFWKAASIFLILPLLVFSCSSTKEIKKPPQLTFDYPVLSKAIQYEGTRGVPVNPTAIFSTDDTEAIASLKLKNLSGKHTLRWDWYDPNSKLYYSTGNSPIKVSKGKYRKEATAWHKISIRGEKAAHNPGDWKVRVYLDKEFIASKDFKIQPTLAAVAIDVDVNIPKTGMRNPDAIALVIGNRRYHHRDVPKVTFAHRDAEIMRQYLIRTLGYREGNILFESDITKARFEALLGIAGNHHGTLYDYVKPGKSDVFIYYSGHGAPDSNTRKGFFVPVDCDPSKVVLNGYPLDIFYENLSKLEAKSITVVIDACFSGGTSSGGLLVSSASPIGIVVNNPAIAKENTIVLASSKGNQISSWYDQKGHGLFTYFFLKALGGSADRNRDRKLTFEEIYEFISDRAEGVPYWAKRLHGGRIQTPDMQGIDKQRVFAEYK
jgi:hypothetical protein